MGRLQHQPGCLKDIQDNSRAGTSLQGFDKLQCISNQPMHDSTACRQQIETICKQLLDEVSRNPELGPHLLRQLQQVQISMAAIKAGNLAGTAHPMAVLSRVQDTWGNSLARNIMDLDSSFLKQRKRQKQTSSSDATAEQEAQPLSKPAPAMQRQGPRAQAKAASAGKEKSPPAANAQTGAQRTV